MLPSDRRVEPDSDGDRDALVEVDLRRLRGQVDPAAQWRQMFDETGRLMRDHFWIEDMAGVDWDGVLAKYRPLVDRIATRDDLSDLFWEIDRRARQLPCLREPAGSTGRARPGARPTSAPTWSATATALAGGPGAAGRVLGPRGPLAAVRPGRGVRAGDEIARGERPPGRRAAGPGAAAGRRRRQAGRADREPPAAARRAAVVVLPLADERRCATRTGWPGAGRAVHEASDGRIGYLHIPDMVAYGWAAVPPRPGREMAREALVVDARGQRRRAHLRAGHREAGPAGARLGQRPAPARRDVPERRAARADGLAHQRVRRLGRRHRHRRLQGLGLGPVVGTRTWGGVIGIDGRYTLVDGTSVTQPRYAFWFEGVGWGVENYGVDPDVEVDIPRRPGPPTRTRSSTPPYGWCWRRWRPGRPRPRPTGPPAPPGARRNSHPANGPPPAGDPSGGRPVPAAPPRRTGPPGAAAGEEPCPSRG